MQIYRLQIATTCIWDVKGSYWIIAKFVKDHSCQLESLSLCVPTKVITSIIAPKLQDHGHIIHSKDVIREMQTDHGIQILYRKALKEKKYVLNLV